MDGGFCICLDYLFITRWLKKILLGRKLLRSWNAVFLAIMNPAMILTFVLGFWMVLLDPYLIKEGWFHLKVLLVFILAGVHGKFAVMRKGLESGENIRSDKYYRVWNEVPTVLMIVIVILVVVKPF